MVAICGEPVMRVREGQELKAWRLSSLKVPCEKRIKTLHALEREDVHIVGVWLRPAAPCSCGFFRVWSLVTQQLSLSPVIWARDRKRFKRAPQNVKHQHATLLATE